MPYMYILECSDGSYYTGSTVNIEKRLWEHENMLGANYTKKRLPVKLVYCEKYQRIDEAFQREKQVQGWSRVKKKTLIEGNYAILPTLSGNYTEYGRPVASTGSATALRSDTTVGSATATSSEMLPELVKKAPPEIVKKAFPELVEGSA